MIRWRKALVLSVKFHSHHQRQKDKLKFKSVVCEQNSSLPVIKRPFCGLVEIVYSEIANGVKPLPGTEMSPATKVWRTGFTEAW